MPSAAKLIITAPSNTPMAFASAWIKTQAVFKKYVRCNGRYDTYEMFLSSGLPYHLPFSFDASQAESFATELRKAGCQVTVVAAS